MPSSFRAEFIDWEASFEAWQESDNARNAMESSDNRHEDLRLAFKAGYREALLDAGFMLITYNDDEDPDTEMSG